MEGGGNYEQFTGSPGGQEKAKESQEKFQEKRRQSQAATQQIRKEEKKKKQQDDSLARIIVQFLGQSQHTPLFLLISRLLARDIPSDLILAIIALIHLPAAEVMEQKLLSLLAPPMTDDEKANSRVNSGVGFSPEIKLRIDAWTYGIATTAFAEARRVLRTASDGDDTPNSGLVQIFALILREFLESKEAEMPTVNLKEFGNVFFQNLFQKLRKSVGEELYLTE